MMQTHFTWSIEKNHRCPICDGETLLVVAFPQWKIAEGDKETFQNQHHEESGVIEVEEEVSGHVCPQCGKLVSLSINT